MNILEAIKERRSVRTYSGEPLSARQSALLTEAIDEVINPFGGRVTIRLRRYALEGDFRPSTYGVIKGATDFFLVGMADDETSELAAGFCFEQIVLKARQEGLGTCWIAATFKDSDFKGSGEWPEGEKLRIVSPVGVPGNKRMMERLTGWVMRSAARKPFADLFFDGGFDRPLSPDSRYGEALEMMRLAPSSTNSQPWRALVEGDTVHFFCKTSSRCSVIDMGIGICHFYLTEQFRGRDGRLFKTDVITPAPPHLKYICSYTAAR